MRIQIDLNANHPAYADIEADLSAEISAMMREGLTMSKQIIQPKEDQLDLGTIARMVIENREAIVKSLPLITSLIQLAVEVLRRRGVRRATRKKAGLKRAKVAHSATSPGTLTVNGQVLVLPPTDDQARAFIKKVTAASASREKQKE
jgi:hypothetical protein